MKSQENICLFCSLGCGFAIESDFGGAVNLEYLSNDPICSGSLCSKGNYMLDLLNHPMRLSEPTEKGAVITWEDAISATAKALGKSEGSAAVVLSGDASLEDVSLAIMYAKECLNASVAVHFATGDDAVLRAIAASGTGEPATIEDVEKSKCTIAVGDPFEVGPVIAGPALNAKYAHRANTLAVVSESPNRTARFASTHIEGNVRVTLAELLKAVVDLSGYSGPLWKEAVRTSYPAVKDGAVKALAEKFVKADQAVVIIESQDPVAAEFASLIVEAAGNGKKLFSLYTYGNAEGIVAGLNETDGKVQSVADVIGAAMDEKLNSLLVLGADIFRGMSKNDAKTIRGNLDFIAAGAPFANETTTLADIVMPTALWLETAGTYNGKLRTPVLEPTGGALSYGDIIRKLVAGKNQTLSEGEVKTNIMRTEPSESRIGSLLKEIEHKTPQPVYRSTVLSYSDGSLTDNTAWMQLQKKDAS